MDSHVYRGAVHFLALNSLDVDDIFLAIDLNHFADLLAFVVTTHNLQTHITEFSRTNLAYHFVANYF